MCMKIFETSSQGGKGENIKIRTSVIFSTFSLGPAFQPQHRLTFFSTSVFKSRFILEWARGGVGVFLCFFVRRSPSCCENNDVRPFCMDCFLLRCLLFFTISIIIFVAKVEKRFHTQVTRRRSKLELGWWEGGTRT